MSSVELDNKISTSKNTNNMGSVEFEIENSTLVN